MWKNERRSELIRNILIGIILATFVVGLGYGYIKVQNRIQEEDALLLEVQSSQLEALSSARQ